MSGGLRIILIGPPGAGKGTAVSSRSAQENIKLFIVFFLLLFTPLVMQAPDLVKEYGVKHLSTGIQK